ncbi:hypothetical protein JCGZ_26734 [Jatropha curcas]|uniref:Uncharacterized protein n=2 Tax=Jatropha curcas TaxID=180498 RepID=A0A067JVN5_JATCU|nr:hypothetical protein JCGZ_26734 [Jatropha curcas]
MIEIEEDDDDFISRVAEAEARALSNKRCRVTNPLDDAIEKKKKKQEGVVVAVEEGAYITALRGTKSPFWQQQNTSSTRSRVKPLSPDYSNQSNAVGGSIVDSTDASEPLVPQKSCPCGLGACVIFTANTERNHGRKFYKCPVRQENGGCGFFEWCDNASGMNNHNIFVGHRNIASNFGFSDLPCPCGAGSCLILTAKTGNNIGQQFYRCPANQGSSCGFFKWCNDNVVTAGLPASASKGFNKMNDTNNKSNGRTGSSCFKCGNEGHWAKDCPNPSPNSHPPAEIGRGTAAAGSCYKCGKPGHWARNCTASQYTYASRN